MTRRIGINLVAQGGGASGLYFRNLFRQGGIPFGSSPLPDCTPAGWPTGFNTFDDGRLIFYPIGDQRYHPAGTYTLRGSGKGYLRFDDTHTNQYASPSGGDWVLTFESPGTSTPTLIDIAIFISDPADPIVIEGLYAPGDDGSGAETQPFTTTTLSRLSRFGCIRGMDASNTNNNDLASWADRGAANWQFTYAAYRQFYPYEVQAQLASALGCDLWVCIPTYADQAFINEMVAAIYANLAAGLKVYVEFSNEIWNYGFYQATWIDQMAVAYVNGGGDTGGYPILVNPTTANHFNAGAFFQHRAVNWFRDAWIAAGGSGSSVRRVIAAQAGYPAQQAAQYDAADMLGGPESWDVASVACYPTLAKGDLLALAPRWEAGESVDDEAFALLQTDYDIRMGWVDEAMDVAAARGKPCTLYEWGTDINPGSEDSGTAYARHLANSARMGAFYARFVADVLALDSAAGPLEVACHFNDVQQYSRFGTWPLAEYDNRLEAAPKWQAVAAAIDGTPPAAGYRRFGRRRRRFWSPTGQPI